VAQFGTGQPVTEYSIHGETGFFIVEDSFKIGRDLRGKGRLNYVGEHHLQFAETGEWFLKGGVDSPENLLAYDDFDDTPDNKQLRKSWTMHIKDYKVGDSTWSKGKGKGLIGAINYLSAMGLNAISFLTMNINGDDRNVFPYISPEPEDRTRIDVSKTAQWEIVMEHADKMGMFMHFKLQEQENDQLLDAGALGEERTLYFRELIARFGHHLALNWNMGEENTNTGQQRLGFAEYFRNTDPYQHPVVVHTFPDDKDEVYGPLLQNQNGLYVGASLQISNPSNVFEETLFWVKESAESNQKWIVSNDEQGPSTVGVASDLDDPSHDVIRSGVLWGNIMAGGGGVEYYYGYDAPNSDLTLHNFRTRAKMFDQTRHALEFFSNVPFQEMSNDNDRIDASNDAWCLIQSNNGGTIVVYLLDGADGETTIDLQDLAPATYSIQWFNPRTGGKLQNSSVSDIVSGTNEAQGIGAPPLQDGKDWAVLLRKQE
jgi:Putative collagen-binding domain of a collagenase